MEQVATELLRELTKSYEFYSSLNKPKEEWDDYDMMMYPIWKRVAEFLTEQDWQ